MPRSVPELTQPLLGDTASEAADSRSAALGRACLHPRRNCHVEDGPSLSFLPELSCSYFEVSCFFPDSCLSPAGTTGNPGFAPAACGGSAPIAGLPLLLSQPQSPQPSPRHILRIRRCPPATSTKVTWSPRISLAFDARGDTEPTALKTERLAREPCLLSSY